MMTSVIALMISAGAGGAWAQAAPEQATPQRQVDQAPPEAAQPSEIGSVEVTGSRLATGDPTSRVIVITKEEIQARGVTSVEQLIRTLPQNVNTIGAITNERARGPLSNRGQVGVSQIGSLGVSAANLGGMGAGNTLILVNGRRVAGAAGIEDGFANLNGIPLSAVERVEISIGGASAIYGADAIGGVINFILRKDFIGTTLTVQHEESSNEADNSRISLFSGYAWGSGSLSGTVDFSRRKPINNYKSGYVTENYSSYYGGDTSFDTRSFTRGLQPGVIDRSTFVFDPVTFQSRYVAQGLTVRPGFVGRPALTDFITVGAEALPDVVPEFAGPESESISGTLNFEQKITSKLSVFADVLYSRFKAEQDILYSTGLRLQLAPGQAYNPFPAYPYDRFTPGPIVNYSPKAEVEAGILPSGRISNTATQFNLNAGLRYEINADTRLELLYTRSKAETSGQSPNLGSVVDFRADATSPSGVRCYNAQLAENRVTGADREYLQGVFDRQCVALTSSDPTRAFNPWKSTADGGGSSVADFYYIPVTEVRSTQTENWEARLNGSLHTLPAGKMLFAIGAEMSVDDNDSKEVRIRTINPVTRDRHAYFGELTIPIFGGDFNYLGARSLLVSLAARRDSYTTEGPVGTVNNVPYSQGGQLLYDSNTFANTTPAVGVRWEPFTGLALRARWTEGFQAPPFTQLFNPTGNQVFTTTISNDPLYTCTTDCSRPGSYVVPSVVAPNPDLEPQVSTQVTYGMTWRPTGWLDGLTLDVSYNATKIDSEYANPRDLQTFLTQREILQLSQFYPRDANGKIIQARNLTFNIIGSEYESIAYELSYLWGTPWGTFEPKINVVDNIKAQRQAFANREPISALGFLQGPDDYKVIGSVGWYYHDLSAALWAYYTPEYTNDYDIFRAAGNVSDERKYVPVDDMLVIDLTAAWRINNDIRVNFAGRNILDEAPPFVVVQGRPYDTARYNAAGRTLSIELQYSF